MKIFRLLTVFMLAIQGLTLPRAWGFRFTLFERVWGNAIVVTDMTPAGRTLNPPTLAKPVYFRGISLGPKLGSIGGDVMPDQKKFDDFVIKVLARQGYVGFTPGKHEATLFLVIQWGYVTGWSNLMWFLGYDASKDALPDFLDIHPSWADAILDTARGPTYGIMITAFDYNSVTNAKPVIYWQTRVGLSAVGKSMADALPAMIVAAGPTIGHRTSVPELSDADNALKGRVDFRELEVVGYEDATASPSPTPGQKK